MATRDERWRFRDGGTYRRNSPEDRRAWAQEPCARCGRPVGAEWTGAARRYCSAKCKQAAYRERRRTEAA